MRPQYESSLVRIVPATNRPQYESSLVRIVPATNRPQYEYSLVRIVPGNKSFLLTKRPLGDERSVSDFFHKTGETSILKFYYHQKPLNQQCLCRFTV
jgi:hypothetical protein